MMILNKILMSTGEAVETLVQSPPFTIYRDWHYITWECTFRKEVFYLTTFSYGYMASDIWLRTTQIAREKTCCCHMGYSFRLTARVLLYAPSHRQDSTYHSLCYTSRGKLAGTRNSSMGPPHEGSIRRPIAPWSTSCYHILRKEGH